MAKFPRRNIEFRHGAQIIKRHEGESVPAPPVYPLLPDWKVRIIRGSRMDFWGVIVAAVNEKRMTARPHGSTSSRLTRECLSAMQARGLLS